MWDNNRSNFDRNLAVVIGIDRYDSRGIHDLQTAVSDANAIANLLRDEYGYKDEHIVRLFSPKNDEATLKAVNQPYRPATLKELRILLTETLPNHLKPTPADRLLFYFAGHGIPRNSKDGPAGYLVPQTAEQGFPDSFLSMRELHEALSKLECHHLLVILDCCFAGTFRWASSRKAFPILETVHKEHYDRFIRYPAWQVLTSAAHDQEALDLFIDQRGSAAKDTRHSPFALALIEGLGNNNADVIQDRVITAHELYFYLDRRVNELSREMQTPGIYPMRLDYDRGEYIFTRPGFKRDRLTEAPPLNEENNPYRGLKPFDERHSRFFFGRNTLVEQLSDRLSQPHRSLTVVLGASGCGKSSLVKAGLIPHLRQTSIPEIFALNLIKACILTAAILAAFPQFSLKLLPIYYVQQWYILDPMRPDRSPFTALARAILPIDKPELIAQLSQVSFLDEAFKPKDESGQNDCDQPTDAAVIKLAASWNSATPEAKLLLVEDYFKQLLERCGNPQQEEQLSQLYRAIFERLESLKNRLQNEPQHLTNVIRKWSETHPNARLLLTIDQFEELITMSYEGQTETHGGDIQQSDRAAESPPWLLFLQVLRGVIVECSQQLHIVLTLRSDFEPRFLSSPLSAYWKDARFPVRAMNLDELRQAIEGPALKQALYFEPPELVGKLIDEVGQMPGALPLLSFTLSELYIKLHHRWTKDNASDRALRIKDYEELGGVAGALTRRATQEYDNLINDFGQEVGKAYQATMRRVMLRMVTTEVGGVERRRVPESELVYPDAEENKRVAQVSDRLVKARLLVKGQETGEPYVEPAHDFLVRGWDKLQAWIKEEQGNLTLQQRLTPAANDWDKAVKAVKDGDSEQQTIGLLWNDNPRLEQLKYLLKPGNTKNNWLNQLEKNFVEESTKRQQYELEETKRQRDEAVRRRLVSTAQALAAQAPRQQEEVSLDDRAALLALHAFRLNSINRGHVLSQVDTALREVLRQSHFNKVLSVPKYSVKSVGFMMDGEKLVLGAYNDGLLQIWDLRNLNSEPIYQALIEKSNLRGNLWAFSQDGRTFAAYGMDDKVRVWNFSSLDTSPKLLSGHQGEVLSVAISPDGLKLASGSSDGNVRLWYLEHPNLEPQILGKHDSYVNSVVFSPTGLILASGGDDETIRLWHLENSSTQPHILKARRGQWSAWVKSLAFSKGGSILASGHEDGTVQVWDYLKAIEQPTIILRGHKEQYKINALDFAPNDTTLASASDDGTVRLWNLATPNQATVLIDHETFVFSLAFSPDGRLLASNGYDGKVRLWHFQNLDAEPIMLHINEPRIGEGTNWVNSVAFSPDRITLAAGNYDGTVRLFNVACLDSKPTILREHQKSEGYITSLAFSSDGKMLATGHADGNVRLWNPTNPLAQPIILRVSTFDIYNQPRAIESVVFSPDSQKLIAASNYVRIWDVCRPYSEPEILVESSSRESRFDGSSIMSIAINRDGTMLAIGDRARTVRLCNFTSPTPESIILGEHENDVFSVAFSPDGKKLASGSLDATVRVWDAYHPSSSPVILSTDGGLVSEVVFSSNGEMLAAASQDKLVRVWDVNNLSGLPIILRGHKDRVWSVGFSLDNKTLASGGADGNILIWPLPEKLVSTLSEKIHRNLTRDEWRLFVGEDIPYERTISSLPVHSSLFEEQVSIAAEGDVRTAISSAIKTLQITEVEAQKLIASALIQRGINREHSGDHKEAVKFFRIARDIYSELDITSIIQVWAKLLKYETIEFVVDLAQQSLGINKTEVRELLASMLLDSGKRLANNGDFEEAKIIFYKLQELKPDLGFDPDEEVNKYALIEKGNQLAKQGKVVDSIEYFQKARAIDPGLDLDPIKQAGYLAAPVIVAEGYRIAKSGDLADAIEYVQNACNLIPSLNSDPKVEAKHLAVVAAEGLVEQGKELIKNDDLESAMALFRYALELDSESEARGLIAAGLVSKARKLVEQAQIKEAIKIYQEAQSLDPNVNITPNDWNNLCWFGSLRGYAREVIFACDRAVNINPGNCIYRDSRGVARALTDDFQGAIEDFQAFIDWSKDKPSEERCRQQSQRWLEELKNGSQPFTTEEIERLLW